MNVGAEETSRDAARSQHARGHRGGKQAGDSRPAELQLETEDIVSEFHSLEKCGRVLEPLADL